MVAVRCDGVAALLLEQVVRSWLLALAPSTIRARAQAWFCPCVAARAATTDRPIPFNEDDLDVPCAALHAW